MSDPRGDVARLLDAACASESEAVRHCALRRVSALCRAELGRRRARIDIRPAAEPQVRPEGRARSATVARLLRNLDAFGIPGAPPARRSGAVERIARALAALEAAALGRAIDDLGRLQVALLCRDLDRASAVRLHRRAGDELASLGPLAHVVPPRDEAALRGACQRLAAAGAATGLELIRALGRDLLSALVSEAAPDTTAVLARRAGVSTGVPDQASRVWARAAASLMGERMRP